VAETRSPGEVATVPSLASGEAVDPGAEAHYLRARALRANAYLRQARMLWTSRVLVVVLTAVNAALVAALIWHSAQTKVVPFVVEVDKSGAAVAIGPADRATAPSKSVVVYALQLFFRNARTVTADEQIQRRLILDAYAYADGRAVALLNDFYRTSSPFARAERLTVTPQVLSVLALSSDETSWQVQWTEAHRDRGGTLLREQRWQATATIHVSPPEREEEVVTNPFGLRIVNFDWIRINDAKEGP
jgi:type IV secretion system protein VirB5